MPAADVTSATVTRVLPYKPGDTVISVAVSIHRRIDRQARKKNRAHTLTVNVNYVSDLGTVENLSSGAVLVRATTLLGPLPDKHREVQVDVPLGGAPVPAGTITATVVLTLERKPGRERDDDDGDDDAISDETYDNS